MGERSTPGLDSRWIEPTPLQCRWREKEKEKLAALKGICVGNKTVQPALLLSRCSGPPF